jgi:hypothetical protein
VNDDKQNLEFYQMFLAARTEVPFLGRFMPYDWIAVPEAVQSEWAYLWMFRDFARELANIVNDMKRHVHDLQAWSSVLERVTTAARVPSPVPRPR